MSGSLHPGRAGRGLAAPRPGPAWVWLLALTCLPLPAAAALRVVIVEGLGGAPVYTRQFDDEARALAAAGQTLTAPADVRVLAGPAATRQRILAYFQRLAGSLARDDRLILYLVGHGSYDGRQYKFNIAGPDLTDADIAAMLDALPAQRQLIVATGSASGALLGVLRRAHRVLITATRSGEEKNATQFGGAFADALSAAAADSNKDEAISAREAFDYATRQVQDYFHRQTLLASEHAVLQGEDGALFVVAALQAPAGGYARAGAGAGVSAGSGAGSADAALRRQRDALNARIGALEQRKGSLPDAQYQAQVQSLLLQLAQVQDRIDRGTLGQSTKSTNGEARGAGEAHAPP